MAKGRLIKDLVFARVRRGARNCFHELQALRSSPGLLQGPIIVDWGTPVAPLGQPQLNVSEKKSHQLGGQISRRAPSPQGLSNGKLWTHRCRTGPRATLRPPLLFKLSVILVTQMILKSPPHQHMSRFGGAFQQRVVDQVASPFISVVTPVTIWTKLSRSSPRQKPS